MNDVAINALVVLVTQLIGYVALGRKLDKVITDIEALKKHWGVEVVRGKVYPLRAVGSEYEGAK